MNDDDLVIDLRTSQGVILATGDQVFRLGKGKGVAGFLYEWPAFPDLLVDERTNECVGLALSMPDQGVRRLVNEWDRRRCQVVDLENPSYEEMFHSLGTSLPYLSVWFQGPRPAIGQMAQLGPEDFAWLSDDHTSDPIGCVMHDFRGIFREHSVWISGLDGAA